MNERRISLTGLGRKLSIRAANLEELAADVPHHYRSYLIDRPGKKPRRIDNPDRLLKAVQRRIYRVLLRPLEIPEFLHGGVPGCCPRTNAAPHLGARLVVRLDLEDFFPSITPRQICVVWERLGHCPAAARVLTSLTTFRFHLPQGAPTSPSLSNLVLQDQDIRINRAAALLGVRFTRYVDDLGLSGNDPQLLIEPTARILQASGFRVSRGKLKVMPASGLQEMTGLSLNSRHGPSVPRKQRDRIRSAIHRLGTACDPANFDTEISSIKGRIRQVALTNPGNAKALSKMLERVLTELAKAK